LRGIAYDQADHTAWQHDLEVIPVLHLGNAEGQHQAHCEAEENAQGQRVHFPSDTPMSTPAMRPFIVDPMMMPAICARTPGVNHAVIPSKAPRIAPNIKPKRILFIVEPPRR
jgi:hypothetical protein